MASSADPVRIPKLLLSDIGSADEINPRNSVQFAEISSKEDVINSCSDFKEADSPKNIEMTKVNKEK